MPIKLPSFKVWCEALKQTEESAKQISAITAKDAAKQWAKEFDIEYPAAVFKNGKTTTVSVKPLKGKSCTHWQVMCNTVYVYSAKFSPPKED